MKAFLFLPVLAIILLSGCTGYGPSPTPAAETLQSLSPDPCTADLPEPVTDTVPYIYESAGYRFSYPANWTDENGWTVQFYLSNSNFRRADPFAQLVVSVDYFALENQSLGQHSAAVLKELELSKDDILEFCASTLAGRPAHRIVYKDWSRTDAEQPDNPVTVLRTYASISERDAIDVTFRALQSDFTAFLPEAHAVIDSVELLG